MNHIELFAGCGGLTLGLESVGCELVMANELSPMAAETFAYNFFGENLREMADNEDSLTKGFKFGLKSNYRDVFVKGDVDDTVQKLADMLGWSDALWELQNKFSFKRAHVPQIAQKFNNIKVVRKSNTRSGNRSRRSRKNK